MTGSMARAAEWKPVKQEGGQTLHAASPGTLAPAPPTPRQPYHQLSCSLLNHIVYSPVGCKLPEARPLGLFVCCSLPQASSR